MWRWGIVALLSAVTVGCVPPRPTNEYLRLWDEANTQERHDHPEEAARIYGKAAEAAIRPRTRWQAAYRQARQLEISGHRQDALRRYLYIAETDPEGEMASRCIYYAGRIAWEDGDLETALTRLRRVMEEYPHKGLALQAIRRSVQWITERHGVEEAISFLREEEPRIEGTDVHDTLLYQWAQLEEEQGRWERALELIDRLAELYPSPVSTIYDDAMWRAGNIAHENGAHERAIGYFRDLVSWREDSMATGSYYSVWTDDSQLMIGQIYFEDLNDADEAIAAFEELADFPASILSDDGLWWASRAYLQRGDQRRSCRALRRLLTDFPQSNQLRQARQAFGEQGC